MIRNIVEFARAIFHKDLEEINKVLTSLTHPGTIGDIYEGTTKKIAESIFGTLPQVNVCDGFIKNYRTNKISPQTDAIIYFGDAEDIPNTSHKIVSIDNVIAMIEVKKNLKFDELYDFYDKQAKVYELLDDKLEYDKELFAYLKKTIFGAIDFTNDDAKNASKLHFYLYNLLKVECGGPLRICIGYNGFKKEQTLRDNFIKVIEKRRDSSLPHTGMSSLPSLVMSADNCVIKMIGYPWACAFQDPYQILCSVKYDAFEILLRAIASKIESKTMIRFNYGIEDFNSISMNNFLSAGIRTDGDNDYTQFFLEKDQKLSVGKNVPYEPIEITDFEFTVIQELCALSYQKDPRISIDDVIFEGCDLENVLKNLLAARIVAINNGFVELITISCSSGIWDGKFYVGENCANQFINWMTEKVSESKETTKTKSDKQ